MANVINDNYEEEIERVKEEDAFFEYERSAILPVDDELLSLRDAIRSDDEIAKSVKGLSRDANESYVKKSIELWSQLGINLHKVNVLISPLNIYRTTFDDAESCDIFLTMPDRIPVYFNNLEIPHEPDGQVVEAMGFDYESNQKLISFHSIDINKFNDYLTACFYCHEIAHTQIDSIFGICKDRLNREVISFLSERIFAFNLDSSLKTLRTNIDMDLLCLAENIDLLNSNSLGYFDSVAISMYMQSYLESFNMANIYLKGDSNIKREMHGYINRVFNGERSVEDMLDHYDSNYKDVPKNLKLVRPTFY